MFEFIGEIKSIKDKLLDYRYQNYGGKVVIIQGHKDILSFDNECVVLKLKTGALKVLGSNLLITQFSNNTIEIAGKIASVEREGE